MVTSRNLLRPETPAANSFPSMFCGPSRESLSYPIHASCPRDTLRPIRICQSSRETVSTSTGISNTTRVVVGERVAGAEVEEQAIKLSRLEESWWIMTDGRFQYHNGISKLAA